MMFSFGVYSLYYSMQIMFHESDLATMDFNEHFIEQGKYILFARSENRFFVCFLCVCVLKGKTVVIQHDLASLSVHVQEQRCDESVSFGCFPPQVTVVYSCDNY